VHVLLSNNCFSGSTVLEWGKYATISSLVLSAFVMQRFLNDFHCFSFDRLPSGRDHSAGFVEDALLILADNVNGFQIAAKPCIPSLNNL
jgi:hypothetical protein